MYAKSLDCFATFNFKFFVSIVPVKEWFLIKKHGYAHGLSITLPLVE
jgi:hypothetical protein